MLLALTFHCAIFEFLDGYSVLDIIYYFKSKDSGYRSEFELPQFVLIDIQYASKIENLSSGKNFNFLPSVLALSVIRMVIYLQLNLQSLHFMIYELIRLITRVKFF